MVVFIVLTIPTYIINHYLMTRNNGTEINSRVVWFIMDYSNLVLQIIRGMTSFYFIFLFCFLLDDFEFELTKIIDFYLLSVFVVLFF